jgi:hypothetical protein
MCGDHRLNEHRIERGGCGTVAFDDVAPIGVGSSRGERADAPDHCGHAKRSRLRKRFVEAATDIKRDRRTGGVS